MDKEHHRASRKIEREKTPEPPSRRRCKPVAATPTPELRSGGQRRPQSSKINRRRRRAARLPPAMDKEHYRASRKIERERTRRRHNDYLAVAVGLLFVTAMLLSFRINDWVMQTYAWDY